MVNWLDANDPDDRRRVQSEDWDVVAVGSSFASMFFIAGLPGDMRVLVLEKGNYFDHATLYDRRDELGEQFSIENLSGEEKPFVANTVFGGNSNCWTGQVPRFHPSDFTLYERHGVGAPWPLSYEDLESFYVEVENLMEVAGGGSDHLLPRSAPFPYPPHAMTRAEMLCAERRPDIWVPSPSARSNGGSRPQCCANLLCGHCPIDSKFSILNGLDKFSHPNLSVMTGAEVRTVDLQAGTARGVVARDATGVEMRIGGSTIALGANAIFNAAILLRSGLEAGALGKFLHEEAGRAIVLDVAVPGFFGGTLITGLCYGAYDGPHRDTVAAVLIESHNQHIVMPRIERGRWTDQMTLILSADDLPQARNAVMLDSAGEVEITWHGHSDYAKAGLDRAEAMLPDLIPFEIENVAARWDMSTLYHIQGTHRMGSDPAESVVDDTLRVHGHDNLFALGAGVFPTCSPANPTLTLSALSLRAGRTL